MIAQRSLKTVLMVVCLACTASPDVHPPWVTVTEGEHGTVSLDTSRIEEHAPGYRVHLQSQFTEPAYRPKVGGPAYDRGELILDIDCDRRQAHNLEATVFDSKRQPVHHEVYSQTWRNFTENDLGAVILTDLCQVLRRVRPHVRQ